MKKLIKKLKKSNVLKKITVFSVITMILISSLTVSSFAVDEDVSAANEEVNSISDTWTSIMNWITSSLGSVQGVFYNSDFVPTAFGDIPGSSGLKTVNLPELSVGDSIYVRLDAPSASGIFEAYVTDTYPDNTAELYLLFSTPEGDLLLAEFNRTTPSGYGWTTSSAAVGAFTGYSYDLGGLTFLGTLSVVGVAIAIIFLLISVIINFLKLRG